MITWRWPYNMPLGTTGCVCLHLQLYPCITSPMGGGGCSIQRSGRYATCKEPRYPLRGRLCGPRSRSGEEETSRPPQGFEPRTVQRVASHYIDWAIATANRGQGCFSVQDSTKLNIKCGQWKQFVLQMNKQMNMSAQTQSQQLLQISTVSNVQHRHWALSTAVQWGTKRPAL
jgi:hypothetical protein